MKINKSPILWQAIQGFLLILTFIFLYGEYFGLKISSVFGIITYVLAILSSVMIIVLNTKEIKNTKELLPAETTNLVTSIIILIIGTVFFIVYFFLKYL